MFCVLPPTPPVLLSLPQKTLHRCSLAGLQEGNQGRQLKGTIHIQPGQIEETSPIGWLDIPSLHHNSRRLKIPDIQPSAAPSPIPDPSPPPHSPSIINQPLLHLSHLSKSPGYCLPQVHPLTPNYRGSLGFIHFTLLWLSLFIFGRNATQILWILVQHVQKIMMQSSFLTVKVGLTSNKTPPCLIQRTQTYTDMARCEL